MSKEYGLDVVKTKLEESFGNSFWDIYRSKEHHNEPNIARYDSFYKHEIEDDKSLELIVQYKIDDKGKEDFEVYVLEYRGPVQVGETKVFTGKYAFKHAKEYIGSLG